MLNDFGDRAVITWDGIGSYQAPGLPFTFQAQLLADGEIVFGYNGIPGVNAGTLDEDVYAGLTQGSLLAMPPEVDYSSAPFLSPHTVVEVFEVSPGGFDLDYSNVTFTPRTGGFSVTREVGTPPPPPPRWETDLGSELTDLTGGDDEAQAATLSFLFPYDGDSYNTIYVGTNGAIALGGLGEADDYPSGDEFQMTSDPMIAAFWSDMDLGSIGRVMLNDFGDRAVITWDGIGSYESENLRFTFQLQLLASGEIVLSYNGIPGVDASTLDEDLHIGLTEGNLPGFPVEIDYSTAPLLCPNTVLELFEIDPGGFDLDRLTLVFTPQVGGGYLVTLIPEPATLTLLALGACLLVRRRKQASLPLLRRRR